MSSDKRFLISTLVNQFLYETMLARKRWVEFAEAFTREWQDLEPSEEKLAASLDHYRALSDRLRQETDS